MTGANVYEVTQVPAVFDSMPVLPPATAEFPPGFCAARLVFAAGEKPLISRACAAPAQEPLVWKRSVFR